MRSEGFAGCFLLCVSLIFLPAAHGVAQSAQKTRSRSSQYTLQIPVDEVSLTFRAFDANGKPLTDLKPGDLQLSDDGKPQNHIVMLQSYQDLPIRGGFLFDTSASMGNLATNRSIVRLYSSRLLRERTDRAFVMQFDTDTLVRQSWTNDKALIAAGAASIRERRDRLPITALFDSVYTTCRDLWPQDRSAATGNFLLLFSDGLDDDSHVYLKEAVDMCQRTRTAIYVITNSRRSPFSDGQKTLEELADESGGRVFFNPRGDQLWRDLQCIEAEQRNQYRLVYRPSDFSANGAFHRIKLRCSVKGAKILTRSGYYAFSRP